MKLLLSGGGESESVIPLDKLFISQINTQEAVLYIPVAWTSDPTYAECLNWFKRTYEPYGIEKIEMYTELKAINDLNKYTAVFIGGGNTFKLLKEIKDCRFDKKLLDYLRGGGFVYGGSAGAIIFGRSIKTCVYADANDVGLEDYSGLNLLGGKDIICHYSEKDNEFIRNYDNDLYILYEESGIFIHGGKYQAVGKPYLNKSDILYS